MKNILALGLVILLSGCMMQEKDIKSAGADEAVSFMRVSTYINGKKTSSGAFCRLTFSHEGQGKKLGLRYTDNSDWTVIKSPPGTVRVDTLDCLQHRLLYNKITSHTFLRKPSFHAKNGVNYVGDVNVIFTPKKFTGADFVSLLGAPIINVPTLTDDETLVSLSVSDKFDAAKDTFLSRYAKDGEKYTFNKSLLTLPAQK